MILICPLKGLETPIKVVGPRKGKIMRWKQIKFYQILLIGNH
jgi:hypothetical protein